MKEKYRDENELLINNLIKRGLKVYFSYETENDLYDIDKLIRLFKRYNVRLLDSKHVAKILFNRIYNIRKALDNNSISFDDYLMVKDSPRVKELDLMYIQSVNISLGNMDDFINAINEELKLVKGKSTKK